MTDSGIDHTITKLNIEAYTDEQLIALGKNNLIHKEMYRMRAYNYFQSHKEEIREKPRNKDNNDNQFRDKRKEQGKASYEKIRLIIVD